MSIFQKTFVFLHHLCTSGAKSAKKNSSVLETMQDKKQETKLPQTGVEGSLTMLGLLSLSIGSALSFRKKKK